MLELSILQLVDALSRQGLTAAERKQLFEAMGRDGGCDAVSALIRRATTGDVDSRAAAVEVLGGMNHPAARDVVREALHDPEGQVRLVAAMAMARLAPRPRRGEDQRLHTAVMAFPGAGADAR